MPRILISDRVKAEKQARINTASVRQRRIIQAREGVIVKCDGNELISFCGNDYLGLSQHLDVVSGLQEAAAYHGVGSTGSALVCGYHQEHASLETEIAEWLGYEKALYFGSGYLANLAVMQSLLGPGDVCVQDKLNHACLLDGARLAYCELKRYPHADVSAALRQLTSHRDGAAMLATDAVFSMDGDIAPLLDLVLLTRSQDAMLYVDDAHGIGVLGPEGRGSVAASKLSSKEVPLLVLPMGKAFGGQGAMLCGSEAIIGHISETARPYLFSTAPPPPMAAAMRASLKLIRTEPWRRAKLASLIARFRRAGFRHGLPLHDSQTAIQPIILGDNAKALKVAKALEAQGYLVSAIRPPTVPEGQARLRVTLTALHTEEHVDGLVNALAKALEDNRNNSEQNANA
ncbi:MAG: 8-amino-7-oxononanoate synthase [Arenimonas sp.]